MSNDTPCRVSSDLRDYELGHDNDIHRDDLSVDELKYYDEDSFDAEGWLKLEEEFDEDEFKGEEDE